MTSILSSRLYLAPILATLMVALALGFTQPRYLDDLAAFVFDTWERLSPRAFDPDAAVRIVAVDEDSLAAFGQWPWPRTRLAEATRRLTDLGAAAIVFDIIFAESDRTSLDAVVKAMPDGPTRTLLEARLPVTKSNDQLFVDALGAANAVLGTTLLTTGSPREVAAKNGFVFAGDDPAAFIARFKSVAAPLPILRAGAKGIGTTNWLPDRDQVIRRVPLLTRLRDTLLPSLALEALRVAQGASTIVVRSSNASGQAAFGRSSGVNALKVGDLEIETGANADIRPYYTRTEPARFLSIGRLLDGDIDRKAIEGRIILVGTTAIGLGDVRATPLDPSVPGVEIQAQIVEALLSGATLRRPDWAPGAELALALLAGLIVAVTLPHPAVSPLAGATLVATMVAACGTGSFAAFDRAHVLIDPTLPSLTVAAVYLVGTLALWRADRISRRHVRAAFGKFLSPAVVDRLAADPRGLVLGGETRTMTIMFSDIRDFAGLSEGLDAHALTQFMNAYLTPMTDAILDHDGTIDKYIGDAIVAFWNAPLDVAGHEAQAVRAALRMRADLSTFNAAREAKAKADGTVHRPAVIGIGLNVGPCTVGNLGSLRRFDYSVLGDAVNLTSRLEGLCKLYCIDIVVSDVVVAAAPDFAWLEVGHVRVMGRAEATRIFTLAGDAACAASADFAAWRAAHVAMLEHHRAESFDAAVSAAKGLETRSGGQWKPFYAEMARWFRHVSASPHRSSLFPIRILDSK